MKNVLYKSFIIAVLATSCSELPEYELPYELDPVSEATSSVVVTPESAVCPGPVATFTTDSESVIYYVVQPSSEEALSSEEVWADGEEIEFESSGSEEVVFQDLDKGTDYTVYSVTSNVNGIRTEAVSTSTFSMPSFEEIVDVNLTTDYVGYAFYQENAVVMYDVVLQDEDGNYTFDAESLWGDFYAWAFGDETLSELTYPGTITLNTEFEATVSSEADYSLGIDEETNESIVDGEGSYDPCTGIWYITLYTNFLDDPETAEVEVFEVPIQLHPAESTPAE